MATRNPDNPDRGHVDPGNSPDTTSGTVALPDGLADAIDLTSWANALVNRTKYREPDPDYLARTLLMQTLTAETVEAAFEQGGIRKMQESIPNTPGAGTGPIEIYGLYVAKSDEDDGPGSYMILDTRGLADGVEAKYTTGSQGLQAQVLTMIKLGNWPIRCNIARTDRQDRGGRYMLWMFPPDTEG